ncbi:MAG: shikimate kinase [Burkholderiaceae bacterium]
MSSNIASNRPIILVGMMGCGKTTVGRRLAARLGREFVDADKEIEARCGVAVATIFELEGETGFRLREAQLIDELTLRRDLVIATGGGAVLREENRRRLHDRGFVIHLRASLPELWHRLRHDKSRPLLRTANPRQKIAELIQAREPLYEAVSHASVMTGRQSAERVVADIIAMLPADLAATPVRSSTDPCPHPGPTPSPSPGPSPGPSPATTSPHEPIAPTPPAD